jgi:hypothetical protein
VKRLALLTDNHLNFVEPPVVEAFLASLAATETDAFLFGGDTFEARMTQDKDTQSSAVPVTLRCNFRLRTAAVRSTEMCGYWAMVGKPNQFAAHESRIVEIIPPPRPTVAAMHVPSVLSVLSVSRLTNVAGLL